MFLIKNKMLIKTIRWKTINVKTLTRCFSLNPEFKEGLIVNNNNYKIDDYTNVTPKILTHLDRNLHSKRYHPLSLVKERVVKYFYKKFVNARRNPLFSVHENLSPIVTVEQNFDSLLIPKDHVSRSKSDCYYLNRNYLLRAHTTAHQAELIRAGLNNFLIVGDVYRRDEIDRTHYPVFHQIDAVRLHTRDQLFPNEDSLQLFEDGSNDSGVANQTKQTCHTLEAVKLLEHELKTTLVGLAQDLFGKDIKYKWIDTYFPFTEPSWELEVYYNNDWLEVLGCGIMKQPILNDAGAKDSVGWAFGLGLERLAMCLYKIPDIRLFWSNDSGFLNQFVTEDVDAKIIYEPISVMPQCINDISFWLPDDEYASNDFYDLVRSIGGELIEQVSLVDNFKHPKTGKTSHCYRIVYRHMEKTLTKDEVNVIHRQIENSAKELLRVTLR